MIVLPSGPVIWVPVPANSSATGVRGSMAMDTTYLYICIATNTWKRITLEAY